MKKTLAAIAALLLGLMVALGWWFHHIRSLDLKPFRELIAAQVLEATGLQLHLEGELKLGLSLHPFVVIDGITLENEPGEPPIFSAARVEAQLKLRPLLRREIRIQRLTLFSPHLLLTRTAEERTNWERPRDEPPAERSNRPQDESRPFPALEKIIIRDGEIVWQDGLANPLVLRIPELQAEGRGPDTPLEISGMLSYEELRLQAELELGPLPELIDQTEPYAIQAQLALRDADGLELAMGQFDGTVGALSDLEELDLAFRTRRTITGCLGPCGRTERSAEPASRPSRWNRSRRRSRTWARGCARGWAGSSRVRGAWRRRSCPGKASRSAWRTSGCWKTRRRWRPSCSTWRMSRSPWRTSGCCWKTSWSCWKTSCDEVCTPAPAGTSANVPRKSTQRLPWPLSDPVSAAESAV